MPCLGSKFSKFAQSGLYSIHTSLWKYFHFASSERQALNRFSVPYGKLHFQIISNFPISKQPDFLNLPFSTTID
jgi:hypothetical protein